MTSTPFNFYKSIRREIFSSKAVEGFVTVSTAAVIRNSMSTQL